MRGAPVALAWAWLALLTAAGPVRAEDGLAWVYAEANTGGSSGGHVALRVGETIYHIQQAPDGLYALHRDEWPTFRHIYAGLQNRTLHVAELDVAAADLERVRMHLAKAYVAQRAALRRRERLDLDLAWLAAWRTGAAPPPLAGAGLLAPEAAPAPHAAALREQVETALGAGFLAEARARTAAQLDAFAPGAEGLETLRETLQLDTALRALDEGWGVAPAALLPIPAALAEPLSEPERLGSARFAKRQRRTVLELLRSQRPDRGRALLLALARHHVLARSHASGDLVLLDAFASEHDFLPAAERPRPVAFTHLEAELGPVVRKGRTTVLTRADFDEAQYGLLEVAAGVLHEYEGGAHGEPVRKLPRRSLPAAARVLAWAPSHADAAQLAATVAALQETRQAQETRIHAAYAYGVLRRNCVTELARLLNGSFAADDVSRALGASLEPGAGFTFIPFAFFDAVNERLRVERRYEIASYRNRELARLLREEPGLGLRLRESVPLSSSIY